MDRRIETLVRRDQNGRPLPPTQAEIANWSTNYGASKAQAAAKEIQDIQAKARAEEQAASENALKAEQARAAMEATRAQAAIAKQKADQEAAAQGAQTEKARIANEAAAQKQQAADTYHKSPLGIGMAGLEGASPPAGFLGGLALSKGINKIQENSRKNANAERQSIASEFDKLDPRTATAAEYESIPRAARQANVIPKVGGAANLARGIGRYSPYVGVGGFLAGEGALQRYLANRDDNDMDPFVKDAFNTTGAAMMGAGLGTMGKGLVYAGNPTERPDTSALRKIATAEGKAKELAAGEAKEALPPPAPVEPYKGNPKDVARYIAHDLGLTPSGKDTKDTLITNALGQIRSGNATPEQIELVTQRARGIDPETILGRIAKSNKPLAALLAATGIGAAASIGTPSEAEAATPKQSEVSPDEREYGTGLPKGAARQAIKGAVDTAISAAPVLGEARMAAETPTLYKPSDEDLADAEYWQRGREEMANKSPRPPSANPEQHTFNPEHLPAHERGHIENPQAAHDKATWMIPYLRAGAEAQKRGEDFFGGSDQYERELAALKQFYHGQPQQAPIAPEAPTEEEAPVGHARGGSVKGKNNTHLKQLNSIADTFKLKLEDKERMIASLEKAVARKPNAKLSKRIAKEKGEVERIKAHLETVRSHAQ